MQAVIVYHKNVSQYPEAWIEKFRNSILQQTFQDFDILEMDYGGAMNALFKPGEHNFKYYNLSMNTFADAMNFLFDKAKDYNYVFNTNVDDWYSLDRFELQMQRDEDIVSSNFSLVRNDEIILEHHFDDRDIKTDLDRNHNILCHPVIRYSKKFINGCKYIPSEIPYEDMKLWQRSIGKYSMKILKENLCFHRIDHH